MTKAMYEQKHKDVLDVILLGLPGVKPGKMFGYPAYYVEGKLFACIYGNGVGVKVPEEMANQLLSEKHVAPFQPFGKPQMREWIQINRASSADYEKDMSIFCTAVAFVSQTQSKNKKRKKK
jgi:hypothetical protein